MIDLSSPYLQRAVLEMLLLAVPAGLLGSWIVLRGRCPDCTLR